MDLSVGVIGVSAHRGWARESHVPAIHAVPGVRLAGVAGRTPPASREAAAALGAERSYDDGAALLQDPAIDVVVAAVPVPAHADVVRQALRAGKHVLTEWPLTPTTAATQDLADLASSPRHAHQRAVIGLQARTSPAVLRARQVLARGDLGAVLSVSATSTTAGFGAQVGAHDAYLEDPASGMHLLTVQAAHTIDLLTHLAGRVETLSVVASVLHPTPTLEGGGVLRRTLPDHVLAQGRLLAGQPFSLEVAGGRPPTDTPFRMTVVTEGAVLELAGGAARGFQSSALTLAVDGQPVDLGLPAWQEQLAPSAVNVAGLYAALVTDVTTGTRTAPDVHDAAHLAALVDRVRRSAAPQHPGALSPEP